MKDTISMYEVTKYQIQCESKNLEDISKITHGEIQEKNPNNCKYFLEVMSRLGIDNELFKTDDKYRFKKKSKEIVKDIICGHSDYKASLKELKNEGTLDKTQKLEKLVNLEELASLVEQLLRNEIEDENVLYEQLAKLEVVTKRKLKRFHHYLNDINIEFLNKSLNISDREMLQWYFIEELEALRMKYSQIANIFSDIRDENAIAEAEEEFANEEYKSSGKIKICPAILNDLINSTIKYNERKLKELAEKLEVNPKELKNELKTLKKLGYSEHKRFELADEKNYIPKEKYFPPAYQVLKDSIEQYESTIGSYSQEKSFQYTEYEQELKFAADNQKIIKKIMEEYTKGV